VRLGAVVLVVVSGLACHSATEGANACVAVAIGVPCPSGGCGAVSSCFVDESAGTTQCLGGTAACCQTDGDCFSQACVAGACSSDLNGCATDTDCTHGAVCYPLPAVCLRPSGAACSASVQCASGECASGAGCACSPVGRPCRTDSECCDGRFCRLGDCSLGAEGDPCASTQDCQNGACTAGVCRCQPAGAPPINQGQNLGCCSAAQFLGSCSATRGSTCSAVASDCFGGSCLDGTCACVGAGGLCETDADCCAPTACASGVCQ
jgi:hypothetical protein